MAHSVAYYCIEVPYRPYTLVHSSEPFPSSCSSHGWGQEPPHAACASSTTLGFLKNSSRRASRSGRGSAWRSVPVRFCARRTEARDGNKGGDRASVLAQQVAETEGDAEKRGSGKGTRGRTLPAASNVPMSVAITAHEPKAIGIERAVDRSARRVGSVSCTRGGEADGVPGATHPEHRPAGPLRTRRQLR